MLKFIKSTYDIEAHASRLRQRSVSREVAARQLLTPYRMTRVTGLLWDEKGALTMLSTIHVATVAQLGRYLFPTLGPAKRARKAGLYAKRLEQLHLIKREKRPKVLGSVLVPTELGRWLSAVTGDVRVALPPTAAPYGVALRHRLAVTELYVRLAENAFRGGGRPLRFQTYPDAWRKYHGPDREDDKKDELFIKPDATFSMVKASTRQSWLVAVCDGGEKDGRISTACGNYYQYACFCEQRLGDQPPRSIPRTDCRRMRRIRNVVNNWPGRIRDLFTVATLADAASILDPPA